jgi:hypothetical protein
MIDYNASRVMTLRVATAERVHKVAVELEFDQQVVRIFVDRQVYSPSEVE